MPSSEQDEAPVSGTSVKQLRLDTFRAVAEYSHDTARFEDMLADTDALYAWMTKGALSKISAPAQQ